MSARKSTKKNRTTLYIILGIVAVLLLAAVMKIYEDVFSGNINLDENQTAYVHVYTHKSFDENISLIKQGAVLNDVNAFVRLAELTGYASMLKPGRYEVKKGISNLELLRMMVSGKQTPVDVTFKYAQRKDDLVRFFSTQLEADSTELLSILNDPAFCDSLGLNTENVLVVFIPNTYNFYWNTSAKKLMERMVKEYRKFWTDHRLSKLSAINLTQVEASVLAAIVQKETYRKDEMPIVAGVYLNRLRIGMPLQADPTLIYAIGDNSIKRVGGSMLDVESPYNTYRNKGLPPGPICVPSTAAIDAVLNRQHHTYIYFCAKEDFSGYHNFASSFAQHQVNARRYQQALNKRGVK